VTNVDSVVYPNRILREMKLLSVNSRELGETVNLEISRAFAVCDRQISHIYFNVADESLVRKVADRFRQIDGLHEVLALDERKKRHVLHERSGDIVLISQPDSWQAYPWWFDDANAPAFARTIDRRKPGFDPCEMFADETAGGQSNLISLDASKVCGSFGAPVLDASQRTALLSSSPELVLSKSRSKKKVPLADTEVSRICIDYFLG
jgi:Type I phosphodiesterase / nucleotide pyrophosphatase.